MLPNPFFNTSRQLRNGWWIALFFVILAVLLMPLLLASRAAEVEVPIWQQALVVFVVSWICQKWRRRPFAQCIGVLNLGWLRDLVFGCAVGAALMITPALLLAATGLVTWQVSPVGVAALAPALGLALAVAATEELLFRGFFFQRLIDGLGHSAAQLIVGAFFLLTHSTALKSAGSLGYLAGLNIFLASVMFGLAFVRTKSLAMPIGIHLAANFTQGGVLGFGVSGSDNPGFLTPSSAPGASWMTGGTFGLEASLPGLLCVVATTTALLFWRRNSIH